MSTTSKQEFVKTFLPETIENINFAQIDMDITDLSLADVLRNVNKSFPLNTRIRNAIKSGTHAIGVLCKTELLYPISGLLLIVTGDSIDIEIISKNYIVISVQEDDITDDDKINHILEGITKYIILEFKDTIAKFREFYAKFIYDAYEMEAEFDDATDLYDILYRRYKEQDKKSRITK